MAKTLSFAGSRRTRLHDSLKPETWSLEPGAWSLMTRPLRKSSRHAKNLGGSRSAISRLLPPRAADSRMSWFAAARYLAARATSPFFQLAEDDHDEDSKFPLGPGRVRHVSLDSTGSCHLFGRWAWLGEGQGFRRRPRRGGQPGQCRHFGGHAHAAHHDLVGQLLAVGADLRKLRRRHGVSGRGGHSILHSRGRLQQRRQHPGCLQRGADGCTHRVCDGHRRAAHHPGSAPGRHQRATADRGRRRRDGALRERDQRLRRQVFLHPMRASPRFRATAHRTIVPPRAPT